jgi:hypothetical protein
MPLQLRLVAHLRQLGVIVDVFFVHVGKGMLCRRMCAVQIEKSEKDDLRPSKKKTGVETNKPSSV